uniref:Uncharacterized protein n=1 Tax=Anguilla anguilla TaxID=7936 RepID=A0A0E9PBP2_ANGAN
MTQLILGICLGMFIIVTKYLRPCLVCLKLHNITTRTTIKTNV